MTNAAIRFKERMREAIASGEVTVNTVPLPEELPAPTPTGNAAMDFKQRKKHEAARARLAELRKEQAEAKQAATTAEQEDFQLLLHQLELDEKRLRELPRGQARDELIASDLLPHWRPMVEDYLADGEDYPNPVLVLVMIWAFNVGEIEFALRCAETAIEQEQRLPERFKRNLESFVADQVMEWAEERVLRNEDIEPHFSQVASQVEDWPVPDMVRIKYLKFLAKRLEDDNPAAALELYESAFDIDPKRAKCNTVLERLRKQLARQQE